MKPFYLLTVFFLCLFSSKIQAQNNTANIQKNYDAAFNEIKDMLEGKTTVDFKRAVFVSENAYDSTLNFQDYTKAIDYLKELCEAIKPTVKLKDYKGKDRDNMLKNAAIYQCLTQYNYTIEDSFIVVVPPFKYDFQDFTGENDWSKMFVTKLLQTQKGNCHSLPYLYKILAEETDTKEVWLSVAPNHIYIKNYSYDWRYTWYNTELTSQTFPVDAWIMASGYISLHAIRNGIYMDTLGIKQSVAMCLTDIARGYERKITADNEAFILKCTNLALQHYPLSINAMLLKAETLKRLYDKENDQKVFNELEALCRKMIGLGYEEMPKEMYLDWLISQDKTNMTEKAPFKEANQRDGNPEGGKPILTLSNGRYYEIHQQDSLEKVGAVIFDTYNDRIAKLLEIDTTYEEVKVKPDVASRFLSVDPIAREFPFLTPYQFASNTPIQAIDLDGLEAFFATNWENLVKYIEISTDVTVGKIPFRTLNLCHTHVDQSISVHIQEYTFPTEATLKWAKDGNLAQKAVVGLMYPKAALNKGKMGKIYKLIKKPMAEKKPGLTWGIATDMYKKMDGANPLKLYPDPKIDTWASETEWTYQNTFLHVGGQALMTILFGEDIVEYNGYIHENKGDGTLFSGSGTEVVDHYTDLINNAWGRKFGKEWGKENGVDQNTKWTTGTTTKFLNSLLDYFHQTQPKIKFKKRYSEKDNFVKMVTERINQVMGHKKNSD